jgi:hypothetical protein
LSYRIRFLALACSFVLTGCYQTVVIETIDYSAPQTALKDEFTDDVFDPLSAPDFNPSRVDPRQANGWTVNLSSAVTRLDIDPLKPDEDRDLLELHGNYLDAIKHLRLSNAQILPSVNLIDGKAKQFDDGFLAALELYWFQEDSKGLSADLDWLSRLSAALPGDSRAAAYVSFALELAGRSATTTNEIARSQFKDQFGSKEIRTKPVGFYTWTEPLRRCYRVGRYLQMEFEPGDREWIQPIISALRQDSKLLADYRQVLARWARLSNLPSRLTIVDLIDHPQSADLDAFCQERNISSKAVSFIPPGSNRESELTRRLFRNGFPPSANLMRELINAIRQGNVNLEPTLQSGWYDYQVFALESLLLPKKAEESNRLLLTANYHRRNFEAFQALMTKRKETHILRTEYAAVKSAPLPPPLEQFSPRLRVEPAPTYYLRMARSYRFLNQVLINSVDAAAIQSLHGLRERGIISQPLHEELRDIQRLFYGCYAWSAEDLGMPLHVTPEEKQDLSDARDHAERWILDFANDPDLDVDTRVIVPVAEDLRRQVISSWATLGVRFARLKAQYEPQAPRLLHEYVT